MPELKDLLELELCGCLRSWCAVFDGGFGENGKAFSIEDVKEWRDTLKRDGKKIEKHLTKLIKEYENKTTNHEIRNH